MQLIPVVDIAAGAVVHAVRGQRERYRPIESALCRGSEPLTVATTLIDYCGARVLYVADLDALTGRAPQYRLVRELAESLGGIEVWLDAGFHDVDDATSMARALGDAGRAVIPVFGTESLASPAHARHALGDREAAILSLDRNGQAMLDPAGCWNAPQLWPSRVIVMTLDRVGSNEGPDLAAFRAVRSMAPSSTSLFGAGGIRSGADVDTARAAGADGWLVASALHERRIPRIGQ